MGEFHALVDAMPGHERVVESALRAEARLKGVAPCREKSHDFLVKFEVPSFAHVDEVLQSYVRRLPGVIGVEIVVDWDDHGEAVREARATLG